MNQEEILDYIRKSSTLDADDLYRRYTDETDAPSPNGFLQYLYEHHMVDAPTWCEMQTAGDVEVTQIQDESFDATEVLTDGKEAVSATAETVPAQPGHAGGELAARYDLLGALGEGAMGEVHLARDRNLRRVVAFKKVSGQLAGNKEVVTRFFTEAQITSQLDHPHVVPVYGLEVSPDGSLAYAMKLVQGRELTRLIQETRELYETGKPIDSKHALEYRLECFLKVCDAIAFAHNKGIIHRDLKPANIMIGRYNEVYVMDWGIARVMGTEAPAADRPVELVDITDQSGEPLDTERTRMGTAIGTPAYMSPEQARGENSRLDGRSDLFSLGLILSEVVTLKRAIRGKTFKEVFTKAMKGKREPIEHVKASVQVPRELNAVIEKATRAERDERYASVAELGDEIRRFLHGNAVEAHPDNRMQKLTRWIAKHRDASLGIIATAVMLVLGAAATVGTLVYEQGRLDEARRREQRVSEYLSAVAAQSHFIDNELHRYEAELENIAGATEMVLTHAESSRLPVHFSSDFAGGPEAPPDLSPASYYGTEVSLDWPVYAISPGVSRDEVMPELRKLEWLRPIFRTMMLDSRHEEARALSLEDQKRILAEEGVPMHRVFVSLADGVHVAYPGMGGYPEDYDARQQPHYTLAANQSGIRWGQRYQDEHDKGLILPASLALYDDQGRFQGVAGFEVTLDHIIENLISLQELDYIEETALVDGEGMIMVRQAFLDSGSSEELVEATRVPFPEVVDAIIRGAKGLIELTVPAHRMVAYYPLQSLGWYYVVVADAGTMLAGAQTN